MIPPLFGDRSQQCDLLVLWDLRDLLDLRDLRVLCEPPPQPPDGFQQPFIFDMGVSL